MRQPVIVLAHVALAVSVLLCQGVGGQAWGSAGAGDSVIKVGSLIRMATPVEAFTAADADGDLTLKGAELGSMPAGFAAEADHNADGRVSLAEFLDSVRHAGLEGPQVVRPDAMVFMGPDGRPAPPDPRLCVGEGVLLDPHLLRCRDSQCVAMLGVESNAWLVLAWIGPGTQGETGGFSGLTGQLAADGRVSLGGGRATVGPRAFEEAWGPIRTVRPQWRLDYESIEGLADYGAVARGTVRGVGCDQGGSVRGSFEQHWRHEGRRWVIEAMSFGPMAPDPEGYAKWPNPPRCG